MEKEIDELVEEPTEEDNVEAEDFDEEELTPIIIPEIIEEEEVIPVIPPRPEAEEVITVELPMVPPPPKEVEEETEIIEE